MKIEDDIKPPNTRRHTGRLTDDLKRMKPNQSSLLDVKTASCLRAYGRYHKWETCQQEERPGKIRVWRIK